VTAPRQRPLVIFGAGGHGKVVADILLALGEKVTGFLDDGKPSGTIVLGLPVLGSRGWLDTNVARVALGVGDNATRARVADACEASGSELVSAVHPRAVVAASVRVDPGAVVMALAVANADAVIGRGAIVNTAAVIEHDCIVGCFAHVSPGAVMGGGCRIDACAQLGIGAAMLPGTSIGEDSIVGGGALVAEDVPSCTVATGVPARARRPT
jgi:sugar O-acyltransferase (sialic acid O-acetyltransferase NeuD family)